MNSLSKYAFRNARDEPSGMVLLQEGSIMGKIYPILSLRFFQKNVVTLYNVLISTERIKVEHFFSLYIDILKQFLITHLNCVYLSLNGETQLLSHGFKNIYFFLNAYSNKELALVRKIQHLTKNSRLSRFYL